jgi:hypothetical protein
VDFGSCSGGGRPSSFAKAGRDYFRIARSVTVSNPHEFPIKLQTAIAGSDSARPQPFVAHPELLHLDGGGCAQIEVTFVPSSPGTFDAKLLLYAMLPEHEGVEHVAVCLLRAACPSTTDPSHDTNLSQVQQNEHGQPQAACPDGLTSADTGRAEVQSRLSTVVEEEWQLDCGSDDIDFGQVHCSMFYRFPVRISNTSVAPTRLRVRTESQHTDIDVGQAFAVCVATEDTDTIGVATPVPSRAADQQLQRTIPSGEEFTVAPGDTILWVYFHAVGYDAQANVLAAYHASLYVQSVAQPDTMSKHSMVAVAGSVRLQVPDDEQLLLFTGDASSRPGCSRKLSMRNAGCLPAHCRLETQDACFAVQKVQLQIDPGQTVVQEILFNAAQTDERLTSAVDDAVVTSHLLVSMSHECFQIPLRAEVRWQPQLVCSCPILHWGCVAINASQTQSLVLRNRSSFPCVCNIAIVDDQAGAMVSPFTLEGADLLQLAAQSEAEITVRFTPTEVSFLRHGLFVRDKYGKTYKVPLLACGGVSAVVPSVALPIDFGNVAFGADTSPVEVSFMNKGCRTGFVHLDAASAGGRLRIFDRSRKLITSAALAPRESHSFFIELAPKVCTFYLQRRIYQRCIYLTYLEMTAVGGHPV